MILPSYELGRNCFTFPANSRTSLRTRRMIWVMFYDTEHLSSLRREISDLQERNTRYSEKNQHSPIEQSAQELRTTRLLQIKQELSNMLNFSSSYPVWWDKLQKPDRAA